MKLKKKSSDKRPENENAAPFFLRRLFHKRGLAPGGGGPMPFLDVKVWSSMKEYSAFSGIIKRPVSSLFVAEFC